jgi:hypothetical protein
MGDDAFDTHAAAGRQDLADFVGHSACRILKEMSVIAHRLPYA